MSEYAKFYFKPAAGEHISTVVRMENDVRSAVSGTVLESGGEGAEDALVLLSADGRLLSGVFTGPDGRFVFGPLEPDVLYLIQVYRNRLKIRELEIRTE